MTLPLCVQGFSRARFIKRESTRTEQEPIKTQELTRITQDQPGSTYSFQRASFYRFFYTSRNIVFAYLTRIKEDFIWLIWGVCHLQKTPWLLVTILISLFRFSMCKCTEVQISIWKSSKARNTRNLIGSGQCLCGSGSSWWVQTGSSQLVFYNFHFTNSFIKVSLNFTKS